MCIRDRLIGTVVGGGICLTLYALTSDPIFIAFSGLGAAFGMVYGAEMCIRDSSWRVKC